MSEPLLPTPRAQDEYERSNRKTVARAMDGEAQMTLTRFVRGHTDPKIAALRTSASSPGSEDSTSPSSEQPASDASVRSSSTQPALPFSSDIGPTSPGGVMSTTSPLLPTPDAGTTPNGHGRRGGRKGNGHQSGSGLEAVLLPTPTAADVLGGRTSRSGDRRDEVLSVRGAVTRALTSSSEATPASHSATPVSAAAPPTPATSGPSSPVLLASFDPDTCCWRTFQATLASELPRFSQTLPRSGMTRRGRLYALPTLGPATAANGGSASLNVPTPTASDSSERVSEKDRGGPKNPDKYETNHNVSLVMWAHALLPTPVADNSRGLAQTGTAYQSLPNTVLSLGEEASTRDAIGTLPTTPKTVGGGTHGETIPRGPTRRPPLSLGEPTNPPSEGGNE